MKKATVTLYLNDEERELPGKWAICSTCRGNGSHNPHAYTAEEFAEAFPFPEDVEDYMSGAYDSLCSDCNGDGKVIVADFDAMNSADQEAYAEQLEDDREYRRAVAAEIAFGC